MQISTSDLPLVVDLDGSLLKTDSLLECLFRVIAKQPLRLAGLLLKCVTGGRTAIKCELAKHLPLDDVEHWPYNQNVIDIICDAKKTKRKVCLATAAHQRIADAVAGHLGYFDMTVASSGSRNLKGRAKLDVLNELFGRGNFAYIGDSRADMPILENCGEAIIVGSPTSLLMREIASKRSDDIHLIPYEKPYIGTFIQTLRLRQWPKNLLIFVPQLLGHVFTLDAFWKNLLAFFAFSFLASAVYIFNDIMDLPSDRVHPRKRLRPFASGALSLSWVFVLLPALVICAILAAWRLPRDFHYCLSGYLLINILYSQWIKRKKMLDVSVLAGMYVIRLIAGVSVIGMPQSNWLLGFGFFIFLALALLKRTSELAIHQDGFRNEAPGRGYVVEDKRVLQQMAITSGFSSIIVLALYIESFKAASQYSHPFFLWLLCPLLMYWFGRLALIAQRGLMRDDPVAYVLSDHVSWLVGLVGVAVLFLARVG